MGDLALLAGAGARMERALIDEYIRQLDEKELLQTRGW